MFPPAVCTSTGTEIAYPLSSTTKMTGSFLIGGGVQRLPEFAFAGGAVAERDVGDFVAVERDVLELRGSRPAAFLADFGWLRK